MGAAITELSETRRRLDVEIPAVEVDAAIDRVARRHSRRAKVPGFRTGKVPVRIVLQRFKEDILQDVAHDLIPQAVKDALSKQALTPIEMPDVQSVSIEEGQPLTFHALFEVMPSVEDLDMDGSTGSDGGQGADILDGAAPYVGRCGEANFVVPRNGCPPEADGDGVPFDPKSQLAGLNHGPCVGFALGLDGD